MSDYAMIPEAVLTTAEAAKLLKISRRHVQWLIKRHELGACKVGRGYRVRSQHIKAFLDAHEVIPEEVPV
jgi:excisionase family DNA binding protein